MSFLYNDNEDYKTIICKSHDEWLEARKSHIGGSDASVLINRNKYKQNNQLWKEKKGLVEQKQLNNSSINYGIAMEPILRNMFKEWMPAYRCQYLSDTILYNQKPGQKFMSYSPDGLLEHDIYGKGILEIKTANIQNRTMYGEWKDNRIPDSYYIQVLHGLIVTGFEYVILVAELRFSWKDDEKSVIRRMFSRKEAEDDIAWLIRKEQKQWRKYYVKNVEPPIILKTMEVEQ